MQEITFAAPKAGPKARPTGGREESAEVAPVDRRSQGRGREDDFGSVVDAEERAAAKKPAGEAGKTADPDASAVLAAEADSSEDAAAPTVDANGLPVETAPEDAAELAVPDVETDVTDAVDAAEQAPLEAAEVIAAAVPDQMIVVAAPVPAQAAPPTPMEPRRAEASAVAGSIAAIDKATKLPLSTHIR